MMKHRSTLWSSALAGALALVGMWGCAPDGEGSGPGSGSGEGAGAGQTSGSGSGAGDNETPKPSAVPEVEEGLWSDPTTWGGAIPGPDDDVLIPEGTTITLDIDAQVNTLTVEGTFVTTKKHAFGDKAAWTELAATAPSGASSFSVYDASGWAEGDMVVLTPTGTSADQFDECQVTGISPDGATTHVEVDCALSFTHEVVTAPEKDEGHPSGKVTYAGEVLNMTRALELRTTMFTVRNTGTVGLENLLVLNSGIDWENTPEGGYTRGVIIRDVEVNEAGQGGSGFIIEGGGNLLWEDSIAYDLRGTGQGIANQEVLVGFGWAPRTGKQNTENSRKVDHVYAVRCVAAKITPSSGSKHAGFIYSGTSGDERIGTVGLVAVGLLGGGVYSYGFGTIESGCGGLQYFWKNEAHATNQGFFIDGNLMVIAPDGQPFVDGKLWRNRTDGVFWGSYVNRWEMHQYHFLGNLSANVKIQNSASNFSRVTLDGEGVSERGVWITAYVSPPSRWAPYARTVFRGNGIDIDLTRGNNVSSNVFIEFPLSTPAQPSNNFCSEKRDNVFQQGSKFIEGPDQMRLDGTSYSAPSCPGTAGAASMVVPPNVYSPGSLTPEVRTIQFEGSHYKYSATRVKNGGAQDALAGDEHMTGFEDWTMVVEERVGGSVE